jgi:hypothetical protein
VPSESHILGWKATQLWLSLTPFWTFEAKQRGRKKKKKMPA